MTTGPQSTGLVQTRPPALVNERWLADQDRRDVVVFEVDTDSSSYYTGHIPGALPLDWYDDLHECVRRGPLSQEHFEQLMRRNGVGADSHVVLAGVRGTAHAAHAYWLLRYYRHARVSLLDGGRRGWVDAGLPVEDVDPAPGAETGYRSPGPDHTIRVMRDDVLARYVAAPAGVVLLDCRTPEEYDGRSRHPMDLAVEHHRVSGRIPGALNLSSGLLLDAGGRFKPLLDLRRLFDARGVTAHSEVVVYCRAAERSALLWFGLRELLGHRTVRHYDGGWAEYGSLLDVPVSRSDEGSHPSPP